jgi:signal transduction histidine kinase/CheY-like chemotaxis protein
MRARRDAAVRLLKTAMVASIAIPAAIFCYGAWVTYSNAFAHADEQLSATLDVLSEQANTVFESVALTFTSVDTLVDAMPDDQIKASEQRLHDKLHELEKATEAVSAIRIFDKNGHVLASSQATPAPQDHDYSDRDYFAAQVSKNAGTFIGSVLQPRFSESPYIGVSRRRPLQNGLFAGVVVVSVLPEVFTNFYARLRRDTGGNYVLLRADGSILARYPPSPSGVTRVFSHGGFMQTLATHPEGGITTSRQTVDGIDRRVGIRKLGVAGLYASAGIELRQIYADWLWTLSAHLVFGAPATVFLFTLVLLTLRRTQDFYAEAERRELAEQALRQSQKMEAVGQLTGGVAHDFNNLLTIIIGNLTIAKRGVVEARAERALKNALTGAERAAQLTRRLLAFSRRQPLNPRAVDVNRLIVSVSDILARSLGENVELETIGGAGLWSVEADVSELEAALLNLALNARDAMPEGGKLTIESSNAYLDEEYCRQHADLNPGQYVLIAVTDNGTGMSAETTDKAFEPFFTTKETGKGTGLGLSQVYGFIKQSGGHVKIYSEVGEGTTVKLYLPRYDGQHVELPEETLADPEHGRGETILIVEDDDGVRQYAAEILRDLNYQVLEARDSVSALKLLDADKRFDLLLTDVVLPGKNGRELADTMRSRRPEIKVIFMTGYSRNAIVHHGRLDRGTELIPKPLTEGVLARRVRYVLDSALTAPLAPRQGDGEKPGA